MNHYDYLVADSRNLVQIYNERRFEKADLVLTSPPYYDTKCYSKNSDQIGCNQVYGDYVADTVNVLRQCYEVTNDNATLWLVMDTVHRNRRLYPLPFDINSKLEAETPDGRSRAENWMLRDVVIWHRPKNLPWHAKGRLKHEFEYVLLFSKNEKYKYHIGRTRDIHGYRDWWLTYPERYNPRGRPPSNIWQFSIPIRGWGNSRQKHLCPLPFPLIERILTIASDSGDVILDPFAGSGSVIGLAFCMDRKAIGLDVSSEYKNEFEKDVLTGAKQYWDKRVKELDKVSRRREAFEKTNIKLRKIKAGLQLHKHFKDQLGIQNTTFFLLDNPDDSVRATFVTSTALSSGLDNSILTGIVNQINSRYRLNISLDLTGSKVHEDAIESLYSYSAKCSHRFQRKLSFTDGAGASVHNLDSGLIYSDIELDIEDASRYSEDE